jgi:hypothetical protein
MVIKGTVGGRARDGRLGPNDPPARLKSLSPNEILDVKRLYELPRSLSLDRLRERCANCHQSSGSWPG